MWRYVREGSERWLERTESEARRRGKKKEEAGESVDNASIESEDWREEMESRSSSGLRRGRSGRRRC